MPCAPVSGFRSVERVQNALLYVSPARITLNPDCGFAPGKDREIPVEEAYAKLKNEVLAAKQFETANLHSQFFDVALMEREPLVPVAHLGTRLTGHQLIEGSSELR